MKDKELEQRIQHALNAELSGLKTTSWQRDKYFENATGGYKVKRKLTYGLVLAIVLLLAAATAVAVALLSPKEVVEQVAVPMAQENDPDWKVNTEFSPEELAEFIKSANESGITIDENNAIMQALKNGEGFDEEETIMEVCRQAFGGSYSFWTLEQKHWFDEMMVAIGFADGPMWEMPGEGELTEEEAKAKMIAALQEEFNDDMYQADYGEEMNLADGEKFRLALDYYPEALKDGTVWHLEAWPQGEEREDYYTAALDREGNVLAAIARSRKVPAEAEEQRPKPTREKEEMMRIAAEGIREKLQKDIPLEDPEKFDWHANAIRQEENGAVWEISFGSKTREWGYCRAEVSEADNQVKVLMSDVGSITADNVMDRMEADKGPQCDWTNDVWAEIGTMIPYLEAETMEGKVVKATPWIAWREGLLTMEEAEEKAFRGTGVRTGSHNVACLIDSQPNPVWKFWIMEYSGDYRDLVVEVDAVTGEITDLDRFKTQSDWEPYYHTYTLHRTWARMELEENGPLYLAQVAVLHNFADLGLDLPEEWSIPIFNETFWKPEIDGNTVTFRCHWSNLPDYRVTVDADGIPTEAVELPSSGTEELPPDKMPGAGLELY